MNKKLTALIVATSLACIACVGILFFYPRFTVETQKSFFLENKEDIVAKKNFYIKYLCEERVFSDVVVAGNNSDIYLNCENQSLVIEMFDLGSGRTDFVYINDEGGIQKVDECSERNGKLVAKLDSNWFLCHGDWN